MLLNGYLPYVPIPTCLIPPNDKYFLFQLDECIANYWQVKMEITHIVRVSENALPTLFLCQMGKKESQAIKKKMTLAARRKHKMIIRDMLGETENPPPSTETENPSPMVENTGKYIKIIVNLSIKGSTHLPVLFKV